MANFGLNGQLFLKNLCLTTTKIALATPVADCFGYKYGEIPYYRYGIPPTIHPPFQAGRRTSLRLNPQFGLREISCFRRAYVVLSS